MGCIVANEATAGATTSERVGADCAGDSARLSEAGALDETCELAGGRVDP